MELVKQSGALIFDPQAVSRGDLLRAKYRGWNEARNGLVFRVDPEQLTVLYLPGISNVSNYFIVRSSEVAQGEWEILWSRDLVVVEQTGGLTNDA